MAIKFTRLFEEPYIFDHAEVLDFSGPFEVFTTASRICPGEDPFRVFLIGETGGTVTARAGFRVIPHFSFETHPAVDLLMVVGGRHYDELEKHQVTDWIREQAGRAQMTASVCTGAALLARAGVLTIQAVTTHWQDISELEQAYPGLRVQREARWVEDGTAITSAGISAGIDMSLGLVEKFHSRRLAEKTARQMEYAWIEPQLCPAAGASRGQNR